MRPPDRRNRRPRVPRDRPARRERSPRTGARHRGPGRGDPPSRSRSRAPANAWARRVASTPRAVFPRRPSSSKRWRCTIRFCRGGIRRDGDAWIYLVTGASGFVGRRTLRVGSKAKGRVRGLFRRSAEGPWDEALRSDLATGVLLGGALEGVDTVFHLAGKTDDSKTAPRDADLFRRVNFDGTARLVEAAVAPGVRRFVYSEQHQGDGSRGAASVSTRKRPRARRRPTDARRKRRRTSCSGPAIFRTCPWCGRVPCTVPGRREISPV